MHAPLPLRVIHVIPAIPACPVCPESEASFGAARPAVLGVVVVKAQVAQSIPAVET